MIFQFLFHETYLNMALRKNNSEIAQILLKNKDIDVNIRSIYII